MTIRSEKQLRDSLKAQDLAPESIDALVKAEKAAGRLKDEEEDDDDDEAAEYDRAGEELAKARREAADLNKAELQLNIHTATDQPGTTNSPSPTERPSTGREPVDDFNIDDLSPEKVFQDLTKALGTTLDPKLEKLAKAFQTGLERTVAHLERKFSSLTTLVNANLSHNEVVMKAARKQSKRIADLQKALDNSPAGRRPSYQVHGVKAAPHPGDPTGNQDAYAGLEDWLIEQVGGLSKAGGDRGREYREQIERYQEALNALDAGSRSKADIARDVGFKPKS